MLQKYTGLFRLLFDKYTVKNDTFRRQLGANSISGQHKANEKVITISELMKLYREHNMDHTMLNKKEF